MIRREVNNQISDIDKKILDELNELPENFWDFKESDTTEMVHGIHTYPAMMIYPISRNILNIVKKYKKIESILDPFSGSGTVLVEGVLAGIKNVYGNDLNPLARLLTKVKTTKLDMELLNICIDSLKESLSQKYDIYSKFIYEINSYFSEDLRMDITSKNDWGCDAPKYLRRYYNNNAINLNVPNFKNIGFWFKPRVILELEIIKEEIMKINNIDIKDFLLVAFSETIRLVSNRRNGEFKMYRMPPIKVEKFNPDVKKEFLNILDRNVNKYIKYNKKIIKNNPNCNVSIYDDDASKLNKIHDDSIDIVITSPPYGDSKTTVAYGEFSRLSLQWLNLYGIDELKIKSIDKELMGGKKYNNGFDNNINSNTLKESLEKISRVDIKRAGDVYSFYYDLDKIIKKVAEKMKKDSYQFWIVGNRTVKGENLKTDVIIKELASNYGLTYLCTIDRNILNKVMPSKNSPSNKVGEKVTTMTNEHIILLKK